MKKKAAVLGATGSVGKNAVDVLRTGKDFFEPVLFSGYKNAEALLELGKEFPSAALAFSGAEEGPEEIAFFGREGLLRAIAESGADIVVNGISGAAGLEPSMAALETGANLALANKETVVMAAPLVFALAKKKNAVILPVDSEHSAIFNLCEAHGRENIEEILLTASGGPFRDYSAKQLETVTPGEALAHPNWKMGPKISVDSATLANKGLEVIESKELFGIDIERITVVLHPQSIVHSMIRLKDGVVYAQLSKPDMRLPLHDALYWPELKPCSFGRLSFENLTLSFGKPDYEKFPLLGLACEAAKAGGFYPAAYNAANEEAVIAFLAEKIAFLDIAKIAEDVLRSDFSGEVRNIEAVREADSRARKAAGNLIRALPWKV